MNRHLSDAEKDALLAEPRADSLSDAISTLQWARTQAIDIGVRASQIETNVSAALRLLQERQAQLRGSPPAPSTHD
jgi:CRISPR/Cas system endoribonuclease Cas6 (RAMP superfamily)